jgi:glyoxylase-like metal-dependent hydrolase (beta-lactamase superfamily II)/rhodanese-related sulfurtransferase
MEEHIVIDLSSQFKLNIEAMKNIEQIYTNCLAQGAYFIESKGEAAVIDPMRETEPYIRRAKEKGVKIKYIFETHFHADFVSGHVDLAKETGATIVYGPTAKTNYDIHVATDGEEFKVGDITIRVLHTPGHTPESATFLLLDENGKEHSLFTGDTLFIGDVGRPDLAQAVTGLTKEGLAGMLFDSLRNKIMTLPDETLVYPGHGAGSACGKNMSDETWDTLGHQKETNYALRADMTRDEFIAEVTDGLLPPPQYFAKNAALNKKGYESIDEVINKANHPLSVNEFKTIAEQKDVLVLDVRDRWDFVKGFVPGSLFIGLDGSFAPWVGALVEDLNQKILLVAPEGRAQETAIRLARVGYDNCIGYLKGGYEAWSQAGEEVDTINSIEMADFIPQFNDNIDILDVRKPGEFETTHVVNAQSFPLDFIHNSIAEIKPDKLYHLHCRSGYRSTVAASILKRNGFDKLVNVIGNFDDMKDAGFPVEGTCPSLVK